MNTFQIEHEQQTVKVTEDRENHFIVELPGRQLGMLLKQDSDGANRWLEDGKDHETEETKSVGVAIDRYLTEKDQ